MKLRSILLLAGLMLVLSACSLADDITPPPGYKSPVPQPTNGPSFPANPPNAAAGAAIFVEKCAACHGETGMGDGAQAKKLPKKPTALGDVAIARAAVPSTWYKLVTEGRIENFMPPFITLTDQQRWDVVAYAFSLSGTGLDGKVVYENNCASCHGADGKKSAKSDFTNQARMAQLSLNDMIAVINTGIDSTMPAFARKLSEAEQFAAAKYLRTFTLTAAQTSAPAAETVSPSGTADATPTNTVGASATAPTPAQTLAAGDGTISGEIVNKSGTTLPTGLKVVLHIFEHDPITGEFTELTTQTTTLDSAGKYAFTDLDMPTDRAFYVSVDYGDTTYNSEPVAPTVEVKTYDLSMDIYDTTTDLSTLVADQVHIILDYSKPDVIQVVEYYAISNSSLKTVIAASKGAPVVTVTLPKGYTNLQFQDGSLGERFVETDDGFGDTFPVPPSKDPFQLVFAFDLPYNTNFDFVSPFSLDVTSTEFLVSEGIKALAPGILDGGTEEMENSGMKYQRYNVGSYKRGETMKINVSGTPVKPLAPPVVGTDASRNLIIGIGSLGLALIVVAVVLFIRSGRRAPIRARASVKAKPGSMSRDEIIEAIIALDDQHNAGKIAQDAYLRRRNELKEKLVGKI